MNIALVIPTRNAGTKCTLLMKKLYSGLTLFDEIIVLDSQSDDGTDTEARKMGAQVVSIKASDFNHGATREMARKHTNADIIVFMTQDAIPVDRLLIEKLVEPIIEGKASFSYARQIPRPGANIFETFPRKFNYPEESHIRGIADAEKYGAYTFFCSDSCAAYLNSALDEIGGFRPTLTNEDYFAAARLLLKKHKVAYVAEAVVEHSHSYTLWEEFKRYFDTGYVRADNPWVQALIGQAESRGRVYFFALVKELAKNKSWLIPYAVLNTFVKLLGYRVGYWSLNAPKWWKKMLSSQRYYWDSKYCNLDHGRKMS